MAPIDITVDGLRVIADLDFHFRDDAHAAATAEAWRRTAVDGYGYSGPEFRRDCIAVAECIERAYRDSPRQSTDSAIAEARLPR